MQVPLIATKLSPPPVQRELVPRLRLIERINQGLKGKLVLISAPAGYGKTMLLSAWTHQSHLPVTWLTLDEGDNDLARFFSYLVAALEKIKPGIGKDPLALLQSPHISPHDELVSILLNEIAQAEQPFVLILDDYHLIHEPAIHNTLIYLLGNLPPQMHLVIASRADPPLQLARMRARSELTEMRLVELCFTQDEAEQFCNNVMELSLQGDQVAALTTRTEGWIAGLQMAAISLRSAADPSGFIRSFSSSHRFILDYLVEEVLEDQSTEIQSFLVKTSILDRLAGPLCDAVTGSNNGQEILENLERLNLFIIPLDEERSWYRYHQLFLDLLRKRALRYAPGEVSGWHRRASWWFEAWGELEEAIRHALAAGDFERAAGLLEKVAQPILMRSEIYTFQNWAGELPEEILRGHPNLVLFYIWALVVSDTPFERVESWLKWVDLNSEEVASKVGVIRSFQCFIQGEITRATILVQQSLASLPADESLFRNIGAYLLSATYVMAGNFQAGNQALEEVVQTSLQKNQVILAAGALCNLAEVHLRLGQLREAKEDYERVLSTALDAHGQRLPIAARALLGLGDLWREWNDLNQASRYCLEGIELAKYLREGLAVYGYASLARIKQAGGDRSGSLTAMEKAWDLALQTVETGLDDMYVTCFRAALDIKQGNLAPVEAWIQQRGLTGEIVPADLDQKDDYYKFHLLKYELLVMARWFIARDQAQKALFLLEILKSKMVEQGRIHLLIETLLLSALAHQKLGNEGRALNSFEQCLHLAEPGGYVRLFLDEGLSVLPLLQAATHSETVSKYAGRLLAALEAEIRAREGEDFPKKSSPSQQSGLIEPLSEREIELLKLIEAGLSNREIAGSLYISLPTVKWHTSNIYSKLGVRSRTQAILQARALGILPAS